MDKSARLVRLTVPRLVSMNELGNPVCVKDHEALDHLLLNPASRLLLSIGIEMIQRLAHHTVVSSGQRNEL